VAILRHVRLPIKVHRADRALLRLHQHDPGLHAPTSKGCPTHRAPAERSSTTPFDNHVDVQVGNLQSVADLYANGDICVQPSKFGKNSTSLDWALAIQSELDKPLNQ